MTAPLTLTKKCNCCKDSWIDRAWRYCIRCKNDGHVFDCVRCSGRTANAARVCVGCLDDEKNQRVA